jgi:NAD(P)-dependent dehydrogenase (short-subunit alcohol dehydrogenase family)
MISSTIKTILVTGSNKGIGFGIIRGLLQKNEEYNLILTARNEELGHSKLKFLSEEFKNKSDKLFYHQLDITDNESITNCLEWIKSTFGQIDILINNAAVATKGPEFNIDVFNFTFAPNVDGTINITEQVIDQDLIKKNGKIIILGSSLGNISPLSDNLKSEFKDENLTLEGLFDLKNRFKQSILDKKTKENGWVESAYAVSKMIILTYARILSKRKEINERNIAVYSCCPGWVRTDMAGPKALLSIEEGVLTPIYLVELPEGINSEIQGKFFKLCKQTSYYD